MRQSLPYASYRGPLISARYCNALPYREHAQSATSLNVSTSREPSWLPPRVFWWLIAAGALAGALGEAGLILGVRIVLHRYSLFNPQGIWLAPIANALLLVAPCALVWFVARRWSPAKAIPAVAFCAAFAAALEPLLVVRERVHIMALIVLAIGVGAQFSRFAAGRPATFARFTRGVTTAMFVLVTVGGIGFNAIRALRERDALTALGVAPEGAPNILLLVLDTVRAASLSAYGYTRETSPFLAELAARGVRFNNAIAPAPWTLASHATMFTGRYPHELSVDWSTPLDNTMPTLAERLAQQGYATMGVAANLHYCSYEFGLDRGFALYRDYDVSWSEMLRTSTLTQSAVVFANKYRARELSPGRQTAARVNDRLLHLLDQRGKHPFFAFANYYDAHAPYNPGAPYDTLFLGRQATNRDPAVDTLNKAQIAELQAAYDASIAALDRQLRDLFLELETRGLLRNTFIIVTSDHGEEFNEHGLLNHGSSLYLPSVHVPLLVLQPGVVPGRIVVESPVTLRDIAATMLDVARVPASAQLPGESLARWWRPVAAAGDSATSPSVGLSPLVAELDYARNLPGTFAVSKGDMRSEIVDGFRFIRNGDGRGELYDFRLDPWEQRDLVSTPEQASRAAALRMRVDAIPRRNKPKATR